MKTLIILAVILGILFLYFIVKAEKSFIIKGNEVTPIGIDIPKLILDKTSQILGNDVIGGSESASALFNKIKTDAGNLVSKTADKISESIKNPIENKINEVICPKK